MFNNSLNSVESHLIVSALISSVLGVLCACCIYVQFSINPMLFDIF